MSTERSAEVDLELLGPVLELALAVAQAGQRVTPLVPAPILLRPYLRFTHKMPAPALRVARRVLDEDEEWRARVALAATEELVGRPGVLFAQRPEGWEEELDQLRADLRATREAEAAGQAGRHAERRLSAAEDATRRAEAAAKVTEETIVKLRVELATAQAALGAEAARREAAERRGTQLIEALAASQVEVGGAQASLRVAEAELRAGAESYARIVDRLASLEVLAEQRQSVADGAGRSLAMLDELRTALVGLRDGVSLSDASGGGISVKPPVKPPEPTRPTPSRAERTAARALQNPRVRVPVPLPPAVFAESVEAARHLVRAAGALVLVDGYNVAKWKWGAVSPAELRSRLDAALGDVAIRAGAEVVVVYDGVDEGGVVRAVGAGRRAVRVIFSSAEVEADDVVLDLVAAAPPWRPVIVVSSDRRVQDGAAGLGANVVSSQQFTASWGASA